MFRAALLAVAVGATSYWLRLAAPQPWLDVALFLGVAMGADLMSVTLPQGGEVTAGTASAVAVALLFPPGTAFAVIMGAGAAALIVRTSMGRLHDGVTRLAMRGASLGLSLPILGLGRPTRLGASTVDLLSWDGLWSLGFVVLFCATSVLLEQTELALSHRTGFGAAVSGVFTAVAPIYIALGALGTLAAVVYPGVGLWAVLLILGLLAVVRQSFNLYTAERVNYRDTVRALAQAIEAQDHETRGHAERTATLALAIGRELGLHGRDLETLSYAALLHDIGKLATPAGSLDALMDDMPSCEGYERFHAERGAEILGQVDYLQSTASLVRFHHHPFSEAGTRAKSVPLGARVIAVATRFDELVGSSDPALAADERVALSEIKHEEGVLFDPAVVRALEATLRRR